MENFNQPKAGVPDSDYLSEYFENIIGGPAPARPAWAELLLAKVRRETSPTPDFKSLKSVIAAQVYEIETWREALGDFLREVEAREAQAERESAWGDAWWKETREALHAAFKSGAASAFPQWVKTFIAALSAWKLHACQLLVTGEFEVPAEGASLVQEAIRGVQALLDERFEDALPMLGLLVDTSPPPVSDAEGNDLANLHVLIGRIDLHDKQNPEAAMAHFHMAGDFASGSARVQAALAEYWNAKGDPEQAVSLWQEAISRAADLPDGYAGFGLYFDGHRRWDEAASWYGKAVGIALREKDPLGALRMLHAPVTGNLCLQLAQKLAEMNADIALLAVEQAVELGISGPGEYPQSVALELKGKILEKLERPDDAADAYYEAGQQKTWDAKSDEAVTLFERTCALTPEYSPAYWSLADVLVVAAYQPDPPFTDERIVRRALETWNKAKDEPNEDTDWAYLARAACYEQLALIPGAKRTELYWQAIASVEECLLLNPSSPSALTTVSRLYLGLDARVNATESCEAAARDDSDNLAAWEQKVIVLTNTGRHAEADVALDQYRKIAGADPRWADAVKANILFCLDTGGDPRERYSRALEFSNRAIEAKWDGAWSFLDRASIYRRLGRLDLASKDYETLFGRYNKLDAGNQLSYAKAAFHLGKIDQAMEILLPLADDPFESVDSVHRYMGLCHLARKDMGLARKHLEIGITRAPAARELDEWMRDDLPDALQDAGTWDNAASAVELLQEMRTKASEWKSRISAPATALEELERLLAENPDEAKAGGWLWIAVHATQARLYCETTRWHEAVSKYHLLREFPKRFRAGLGLQRVATELDVLAVEEFKNGRYPEASEQLRMAISIVADVMPDNYQWLANLEARNGTIAAAMREEETSKMALARAAHLYAASGTESPGEELAQTCVSLLTDPSAFWAVESACKTLSVDKKIAAPSRSILEDATKELTNLLGVLFRASPEDASSSESVLSVARIGLELGSGLADYPGTEGLMRDKYLPEMRDRVLADTGVLIPSVSFYDSRESSWLSNRCVIMIDEVPLLLCTVLAGSLFFEGPKLQLAPLGLPADDVTQTADPLSGQPACWVREVHREALRAKGLSLLDPLAYVVRELEALLRMDLSRFIGVQELESRIKDWSNDEAGAILIRRALPDTASRIRFSRALGALLRERVPITRWSIILNAAAESGAVDMNSTRFVSAVRPLLKDQLPATNTTLARVELPVELENRLAKWIRETGGKTFLLIPPEETQGLLTDIRELLSESDTDCVLVTRRSDVRPFARRLVEFEFPNLMVVSQDELVR